MGVQGLSRYDLDMVRKSIAAFLLLVVAAWAEVLVAPMFTMHALHYHPAHVLPQPATHQHAAAAVHSCCPGLRAGVGLPPALEFAATTEPCADQHRCCFRQAPQSAPVPAGDRKPSRELAVIAVPVLASAPAKLPPVAPPLVRELSSSATLSMILRV